MNLFPDIERSYSHDHLTAREAQRFAEFIAFGPFVFQVSRIMLKYGVFDLLREKERTLEELSKATSLSDYAIKRFDEIIAEVEAKMKEEAGMSSRCIPFKQEKLGETCACCGKPASTMIYWGVAY